ncbi:MAG: single-strand DNA-binding protein [Alteromonadaceae bacterium]|jgi:single-strand DNA-binding protein
MNKFIFTGNLGKDAEVKVTQSGMSVCSFSVAVKSGYGDKEKTTWANCALFGKRAEGQLPQYLKKGAQVCISGQLTLDEWKGEDGTTQKSLKVNVDDLDLIGGKSESSAPAQRQPQAQQAASDDSSFGSIPF